MFCNWVCSGNVTPVYEFQRLSSNKQIGISLPKGLKCSSVIGTLAKHTGQQKYLIDVIEYGKPVDQDSEIYFLPRPIQFVVHQEIRLAHPDYITNKQDMINDWEDEPRVEMSCGHAINPDSLYGFCWNRLSSNNMVEFRCPAVENGHKCDAEWSFPEVSIKACLSDDERIMFETRLNFNWMNKSLETSQCPNCLTYCERQDTQKASVQCLYCKKAGKTEYIFCWFCLQTWEDNHVCNLDGAKMMLQECRLKTIGEFTDCPSVRACPNCQSLIEHDDKCKKMKCHLCNDEFCFVCLQPVVNGNYQCGGIEYACQIAPIQSFD